MNGKSGRRKRHVCRLRTGCESILRLHFTWFAKYNLTLHMSSSPQTHKNKQTKEYQTALTNDEIKSATCLVLARFTCCSTLAQLPTQRVSTFARTSSSCITLPRASTVALAKGRILEPEGKNIHVKLKEASNKRYKNTLLCSENAYRRWGSCICFCLRCCGDLPR